MTKLDQLLYDRSVVRIFIQLWLKSISCYMIDQFAYFYIAGVDYSGGWDIAMKTFCNIFTPFTWGVMCDRYPPLPLWSIAFHYFHREWKKKKKPDTDTSGIFDKYSWGSKSTLFLSRILFLEPKNKKLTSQLCTCKWSRCDNLVSYQSVKTKTY